jgi:CDP-4-dehydro-6-deoxyglucose reductase
MAALKLRDTTIPIAEGETVLSALLAAGIDAPYSCRAGLCHTCLHQAIEGEIPAQAQFGLSDAQKSQGYFLPCVCVPKGPLKIVGPGDSHDQIDASIAALDRLSRNVIRLRLQPDRVFSYRPGQFLALTAPNGVTRSYSIASHPDEDDFVELHVRVIPGGRMSALVVSELAPGDRLKVSNPSGTCVYDGADPDRKIVMAGAGTGLAPLWGVLRDAVKQGHRAPITLYHGARDASGLYLDAELRAFAKRHENFSYKPCVLDPDLNTGDLADVVLASETDLAATDFFLCGGANLVNRLKRQLFIGGAKLQRLRSDIFLPAS